MCNWTSTIRTIIVIVLVIIVGMWELSLSFSDLGPNETIFERIGGVVLVLFIVGIIIGFLYPKRWYLAGLSAWSIIIGGTFILVFGPLSPKEISEEGRTIQIKISEGHIQLSPTFIKAGGLYVDYINEGIEEHELAFFDYPKEVDINQMTFDDFKNRQMRASLRPLSKGEKDFARFTGNYFGVGQYVIICLKQRHEGISHISNGEIVILTIE